MECIVFWQRMLTPHMTELACEVARLGVEVHYVAEEVLSDERRAMGWATGDLAEVQVHLVTTAAEACEVVDRLPRTAVHITQGVRSNGLVADAQKRIMDLGLRHYPIMEKVDLRGPIGKLKSLVYWLRLRTISSGVEGLLAIGETTPAWVARRAPRMRVFPFAYFLKGKRPSSAAANTTGKFRFTFVGGLIELKRVDLLLDALVAVPDRQFELEVVGDGPQRALLEARANAVLPGKVIFIGAQDMAATIDRIGRADCLVLPSDHDGWGAVVSEAQINGTPAICSSECGAAGTVRASGFGGVFEASNVGDLRRCLQAALDRGRPGVEERDLLAGWAHCLTAKAGARYLLNILQANVLDPSDILAPWNSAADSANGSA